MNSNNSSVLAFSELDAIIEEFESALAEGQHVDFASYLPNKSHSRYRDILIELIRVDLEWQTQGGALPPIEQYFNRFPELYEDSIAQELIALEEARVKQGLEDTGHPDETNENQPPVTMPELREIKLEGYEILGELGRGGMGVVLQARELALNRLVAIKMILEGKKLTKRRIQRFKEEAEAVGQLTHPNIVGIYSASSHRGAPYFVMEFVQGSTLAERLKPTLPKPKAAARLMQKLAEAMSFCHRIGNILHRDLKPANILLTGTKDTPLDECEPKITDFGLVKRLGDEHSQTRAGTVMGTPAYMSPEQAKGLGTLGPGVDIYALGAILYEMLVGHPPFPGSSATEIIDKVIIQQPIEPAALAPHVPEDLQSICLKCLQKDPDYRYHSAKELAEDLERFLDGRPIKARPLTIFERCWKWCKRRPMVASLFVVVCLLILGGVVGYIAYNMELEKTNNDLAFANGRLKVLNDSLRSSLKAEEQAKEKAEKEEEKARLAVYEQNSVIKEMFNSVQDNQKLSPDEKRQSLRRAIAYAKRLRELDDNIELSRYRQAHASALLGRLELGLQGLSDAKEYLHQSELLYRQLLQEEERDLYHRDLADVLHDQGVLALTQSDLKQAEKYLQESLSHRKTLIEQQPEQPVHVLNLGNTHNVMGNVYFALRQPTEAQQQYRLALQSYEQIKDADVDDIRLAMAKATYNFGRLYALTSRLPLAEKAFQQTQQLVKIDSRANPEYRRTQAAAQDQLGLLYETFGQSKKAESALQASLSPRIALSNEYPDNPEFREEASDTSIHLGNVYRTLGNITQAKKFYLQGKIQRQQLLRYHPENLQFKQSFADACNNLGVLYSETNQADKAKSEYEQALNIRRELVEARPDVPEYQADLAATYLNIGTFQIRLNALDDAISIYQKALPLQQQLVKHSGQWSEHHEGLAALHLNLGHVLREKKSFGESLTHYNQAAKMLSDSLKRQSKNMRVKELFEKTLLGRATVRARESKHTAALQDLNTVLELNPKANWRTHLFLAVELAKTDDYRGAMQKLERVKKSIPPLPQASVQAAAVHSQIYDAILRDRSLPELDKSRLLVRQRDEAIQYLKQAFGVESFRTKRNLQNTLANEDMKPFHNVDEVRSLFQEWEKTAAKAVD